MRKVKSQADLKRLALASGASVEVDGSKFNTTMDRVMKRDQPEPEPAVEEPKPAEVTPAPEPVSEPVQAQESLVEEVVHIHLDMDPVAKAIESSNEKVVQAVAERLRELQLQVPPSPQTPNSWTFKIKRDVRGFIESVDATPRL